jgi:hypothetical protein
MDVGAAHFPRITREKENDMKRNKTTARKMRGGKSPYAKHAKRPCPHCQDITRADRKAALADFREPEAAHA